MRKEHGNKGRKLSEETKRKISEAQKGRKNYWMIGDKNPAKRLEVRKKISKAKKGKKRPDMVGYKNPAKKPEVREKISEALKGINHVRENNPSWKENWNNLSIQQKHNRMRYVIHKTDYCWICKKKIKKLHLANKDHRYRNCLEDWYWICPKCHKIYDINYNNKNYHLYNKI